MEKNSFEYYVERYIDGTITADEWTVLRQMVQSDDNKHALNSFMDEQIIASASLPDAFPVVTNRILSSVEKEIVAAPVAAIKVPTGRMPFIRRWWVAASIILFLGIGAYLWTADQNAQDARVAAVPAQDILPGMEGAILTLSDGRQVVLDSLNNGVIAQQNGSDVVLNNGTLAYDLTGASTEAVVYNTITTPNGKQFVATLPDGTKVWLNAGSSIQYPTVFNAPERRVVVTGEVYMEVASDKSKPFLVNIDQRAQVEVLGTTFNVNAYQNEPSITTTLIAGAVRVKSEGKVSEILAPGQQAAIGKAIVVSHADMEGVTAWKNGSFYFNNTSITEVMRQIERWYDIEVVYENGIPDIELLGTAKRNLSLDGIIRGLSAMGVVLRLEPGKRLVVVAP